VHLEWIMAGLVAFSEDRNQRIKVALCIAIGHGFQVLSSHDWRPSAWRINIGDGGLRSH